MDPRLIAFYLPQFHPIPENDGWWGRGFTEWTNVARGLPLFGGHYQPHLPADLGFYDLRLPEVREAQAALAGEHGLHGFCYYHYWFHGKRLLNRPFDEVLASGKPDFPFCLCWANEDWTRAWDGRSRDVLVRQEYSERDDADHVRWLLRAFADRRYIRVEGRPLFLVYRPSRLPDARRTAEAWRREAQRGLGSDLFLCGVESFGQDQADPGRFGFDAAVEFQPNWRLLRHPLKRGPLWSGLSRIRPELNAFREHRVYEYPAFVDEVLRQPAAPYLRFPGLTPMWDNSARRKRDATILIHSQPEAYGRWLRAALDRARALPAGRQLVFVNAWNEWAEGNHLEPCLKWGRAYLEMTRRVVREAAGPGATGQQAQP